jgi:hypothetical protein
MRDFFKRVSYLTFVVFVNQMHTMYFYTLIDNFSLWKYGLLLMSGIVNVSMIHICVHECIHGNVFPSRFKNDIFGMLSSLILGLPLYVLLRNGHLLHHDNTNRVDDPYFSVYFNDLFGKKLNQIFKFKKCFDLLWNIILQGLFNFGIYYYFSLFALYFLILCTLISYILFDHFHESYHYSTVIHKIPIFSNDWIELHYKDPTICSDLV